MEVTMQFVLNLTWTSWHRLQSTSTVCLHQIIDSGRGTTRAEHAQGTPTQSYISPSILVYEEQQRAAEEGRRKWPKSRPESGLDWLICSEFRGGAPCRDTAACRPPGLAFRVLAMRHSGVGFGAACLQRAGLQVPLKLRVLQPST